MYPQIWNRVTRSTHKGVSAILKGYGIYRVHGEVYPGVILTQPQDQVEGILYRDVSEIELSRLDAFEGEMYERVQVMVELPPECHLQESFVYRIHPDFRNELTRDPWTSIWFEQHGLKLFEKEYQGFHKL
ncbi:MAG: gamma-glutamylcyclotransferase [SAR324 cluster bacterium]|nr:gamma-glutamylcyclotransferase [SAR324 cluster bacterium]